MIREGTAARNLEALMPLFAAPYYERCMLVTDDKHPGDLISICLLYTSPSPRD